MNESEPWSHEDQPMSRRNSVDRLCDEFDRQWRVGERPRIEDYLARAKPDDRAYLLGELLRAELEARRAAGEPIDPHEYRDRFPNYVSLVELAFAWLGQNSSLPDSQQSTLDGQANVDSRRSPAKAEPPCKAESPPTAGPPRDEDPPPPEIERYEVLERLGLGGFAVVYKAHDRMLDRLVALKLPRLEKFALQDALRIFVDEARKAAKLDHPGIVRIHDVQAESNLVYIVLQYINGQTLTDYVKSNSLAPRRIAELLMTVAQAVGYAHRQGFVHRDLKPDNILLDSTGNPYVADFGLALHECVQRQHAGELAGTLAYMSPEQVRGESHRLDGRSDIWSLGVILYELLTGRMPFQATQPGELLDDIQRQDPRPPRMIDPHLPAELSRICLVCLEKRATDRYQSAADLIDDLQHLLDDPTFPARADATTTAAATSAAPASSQPVRIVPKGLRSFDAGDADFFHELSPGPHDREGLPKSIRFWKTRLEQRDPDETFPVGLLYGPSG